MGFTSTRDDCHCQHSNGPKRRDCDTKGFNSEKKENSPSSTLIFIYSYLDVLLNLGNLDHLLFTANVFLPSMQNSGPVLLIWALAFALHVFSVVLPLCIITI